MSGQIITAPTLTAGGNFHRDLSDDQRDEFKAWLRSAVGVEPKDARGVTYDLIDMPMLRIECYERDDAGLRLQTADGELVTRIVEVALLGALPEWWRPNAKESSR